MDDKQLEELLAIGSDETLLLLKRDFLTALIEGKLKKGKYIRFENMINVEMYKRIEGK